MEKLIHGKPSGADARIVAKGGLLKFQKENDEPIFEKLDTKNFKFLLINTKAPKSTAETVAKVR